MIRFIRTDSDNLDFKKLVVKLDALLRILDGDEHEFYAQFNKMEETTNAILAYSDDIAVGCGAFRKYADGKAEFKRMLVLDDYRNMGIASKLLSELEAWARELGYTEAILETGKLQLAAIHLYGKNGYSVIPNFGQYENVANSICFRKILSP